MATPFTASYNGLSFGVGTNYSLVELVGIDDMPPVRSTDVLRANDHGGYLNNDFLGERIVTLSLFIGAGSSQTDYDNAVASVALAFATQMQTELPLTYALGSGSQRLINCRPRKRTIPRDTTRWGMTGVAHIELVASDPRIYDASSASLTTGLPTAVGGMGFSFGFNLGFGSSGVGGTISANNTGSFAVRPTFTITGQCDNPRAGSDTEGKTLKFAISLASTDVLTVDLDAKSIVLNGTASRDNVLTSDSQWWDVQPGLNILRFNADAYTSTAAMTIPTFRSGWI